MRLPRISQRVFTFLALGAGVAFLAVGIRAGESGPAERIDARASNAVRAKTSRFSVMLQLEEVGIQAFFTEISGLGSESEVVEFHEGGQNDVVRKLPGRLNFDNIVLKRGITGDASLWQWRRMVETGNIQDARTNGKITLLDRGRAVATWHFTNGWPSKISVSTPNAEGNDIVTESITIAHEGMTME